VDRFVLTIALFAVATALIAIGLRFLPRAAVWATGGMIVLFPFLSDTSDWNHWFDWAKRYSVVVPVFFSPWSATGPSTPSPEPLPGRCPSYRSSTFFRGRRSICSARIR
jgi:hypothetical protein